MFEYVAGSSEWELVGAVDREVLSDALRPRRLPRRWRDQIPTTFMRAMVDTAAGTRIRFQTDATSVGVRLRVHPVEFVGISAARPPAVDLVVDGRVVGTRRVSGGPARVDGAKDILELLPSEVELASFSDLGTESKTVELWLPHASIVDVVSVVADRAILLAVAPIGARWLHHGSSISHCIEATRPTRTWPALAANSLGVDLIDMAYAGSAMLDPFVARAIRGTPADVISLEIGINLVNADAMRLRTFEPAVHGFLDTIREGHPTAPIVVISPITCPILEDAPGPTDFDPDTGQVRTNATRPYAADSLTLNRIRPLLQGLVSTRRSSDAALHYLDGRHLFGAADAAAGMLADGLHPDESGYRIMGGRMTRLLRDLFTGLSPTFNDSRR